MAIDGLKIVIGLIVVCVGPITSQETGSVSSSTVEYDRNVTTLTIPADDRSCPDSDGFKWYYDNDRGKCRKCPTCNRGYQPNQECGDGIGAGTKCELCPPGSYSNKTDYSKCRPCTVHCSNVQYFALKCTRFHDKKCGPCKTGYFKSIFGNCEPCYNYDPRDAPGCPTPTKPPLSTQVNQSPPPNHAVDQSTVQLVNQSPSPLHTSSSPKPTPHPSRVSSTHRKGGSGMGFIRIDTSGTIKAHPTTQSNRMVSAEPTWKQEMNKIDDSEKLDKLTTGVHTTHRLTVAAITIGAFGIMLSTILLPSVIYIIHRRKCRRNTQRSPNTASTENGTRTLISRLDENEQITLSTQSQQARYHSSSVNKTGSEPIRHGLQNGTVDPDPSQPMVFVAPPRQTNLHGSPSKKRRHSSTSDHGQGRQRHTLKSDSSEQDEVNPLLDDEGAIVASQSTPLENMGLLNSENGGQIGDDPAEKEYHKYPLVRPTTHTGGYVSTPTDTDRQCNYNDTRSQFQENEAIVKREEVRNEELSQQQKERSRKALQIAEGYTITDLMDDMEMKDIVVAKLTLPANTREDETPVKYYPALATVAGITDTHRNTCKGPTDALKFMQTSMEHPRNMKTLIDKVTEIKRFDIADKLQDWVLKRNASQGCTNE